MERKKAFEAKKPMTYFNCQEDGHITEVCGTPNVAFACASQCKENAELFGTDLFTLTVNGKP